jgi:hypothetical protein
MPRAKHKRKAAQPKRDFAQIAFDVVQRVVKRSETADPKPNRSKNPAAVALGGLGGKARAPSLSKKKRQEIAREAANRRWKKGSAPRN